MKGRRLGPLPTPLDAGQSDTIAHVLPPLKNAHAHFTNPGAWWVRARRKLYHCLFWVLFLGRGRGVEVRFMLSSTACSLEVWSVVWITGAWRVECGSGALVNCSCVIHRYSRLHNPPTPPSPPPPPFLDLPHPTSSVQNTRNFTCST